MWRGQLAGFPLDISITYSGANAWLALLRNGNIGVGALEVHSFPEAEAVGLVLFCEYSHEGSVLPLFATDRGSRFQLNCFLTKQVNREITLTDIKTDLWPGTRAQY
jgi:hypothetical protein